MKGKYSILVQNNRLRYEFTIYRNITIIRGDSATGKTTLLDLLAAYYRDGEFAKKGLGRKMILKK